MLEIKSYDDWTEEEEELAEDPVSNIKKYTDYVRLNYSKAGILNPETDSEIAAGVQDRLNEEVFTEDMTEEDRNGIFSSIVGPDKNDDADARFVLDYLKAEGQQDDARVQNLTQYLSMKQLAPDRAEEFRQPVADIIGDRKLVRDSRVAAADRGDFSVVAIEEDNGDRTFYSGPSAKPEKVSGEIDSLIKAGAISTSDLSSISGYVKPINGGLSTTSEATRYDIFRSTVGEKAKADKELGGLLQNQAGTLRQQKEEEQRTTGEAVLEGAKTVIAYPFAKLADAVMAAGSFLTGEEKPEPKYAPDTKLSDVLGSDENLRKKFSAEEIEKFSDAMVADAAGAVFRADKPETGITTDSMGNPIIAAALLPRDDLFEKALAAAPLNKDQQKMARVRRDQLLDTTAPELLKVILEEEPDAVGMLAKAKADGLSDAEFVKTYVSDSKNYSGFETRLEQFGKSAWKTVAEIPLGLAALSGNEWAAKEMVKMNKDQSRRQEFSRMFGDEYGIGFQLLNTIPQVATDIGLTIGTGGVFAGAKTLAKAGSVSSKTALRSMAKLGLSGVDDVAAQSFRTASTAGGEAATSNAIKEVGRSLATKFAENAPVFTTSFVRSATSTYGSIYGQLPDEMSHEEKHKNALGYSLAAGLSTGVITSGMSFLGRGGVEEVATKRIRAMLGGETDDAVLAAGGRVVPVDKMNYRQAKAVYENLKSESVPVTDRAFQRAMRGAIGGAYKNYMRTTFGGVLNEATEEMVDQAIQMKLEDAALDQETPLSEKVNQIFTAGVIGGGLGGIVAGATQFGPVKKSEQALVFEGRASALEKVATQLRKTNSNATAETVQRMIDDARTRAAEVTQAEAQAKIQEEKNAELATKKPIFADPAEKQLSDEKEQELELTMLGDLVGEKVSAAGFTGTLEADDSGSIFLNTKDGETIHLGSRYEKAQGRVSAFPQLMTFAKDEGKVLAGTPYIVRGKKATSKVAMPSVTENNRPEDFLGVIKDEEGNIKQLVVKGATMVANQDLGMDIKISNGYQIKSLARYYNVSLDSLQDLTPPPTDSDVDASSIDEIEANAVSDEAKASIVTAKEVLQYGPNQNLFKAFMAGDSSKAKFKQTVTNLTPDELNFIAQNANTFFDWVSSDDTIPAETRGALLQSAEDLKSRVALAYKFQVDQAAKEAFANEPDLTDEEKAAIEDELKQDLEGDGEEATAPKTQLTSKEQEAENKRLKGVITGAPKEPTAVKTRKTPEGNSVVEGPSPQDQLRKLMADYSDMEFVVPIVATREGPKTFAGATKYRKKLEFLEDIAYSDAATEEFSAELAELKVSMAKGKQAIGSRRRRLRMNMASLMPAEVGSEETTLTQSEQDLASQLSAIEASRPFKTFEEEEEAQEKRTKKKRVDHGGIAGEDWSTEDKLNVFRNQEEELAFNDLVLGGFRISDLSAYGKAIAGLTQEDIGYGEVPLFTKQRLEGDPTDPMKYLKGKHKFLYRKVIENYPLVTPTSKDEPVTSKRSYTNVETGEYKTIPIPVFRDASYDAVAGEFTNDPIIIREQIDQNIPVTIPKQLIKRSENAKDAFKINPSIEFDPDTGVVMSVIDPITRQPIRFSGEEAYVNGSYIPIKARKTESLLMSLVAPSGRYLSSAGETAKGRQSIGQQVVNNKVVPAKNLNARDYTGDFQKWMMGEVAFDGEFERGAGHRFLKSEFQLDDDSISDLSSYALAEYGLSVYEFAMGKALLDYAAKSVNFDKNKSITKRLTKAAEEKGLTLEQYKEHPDFASEFNLTKESLRDLNPVGVVADFFYTNSKEAMATAIAERHPNLSGSTAHNVITKYAEFLYERVNEPDGDLFTGPKNPLNILKKFGKDYQNAEKARNIRKTVFFRGMGEDNESVLDTLLATGKLNDYALDPLLSSSRDMVDDDPETATTYRISLRDSLIRQINDMPELKRAMKDIALLFHKGFEVLESGEMIVDVLNNKIVSITGDNRDISMAIVNRLSGLKTGLRAAGVMSELGWLPPVAKFEAIPPTVEPPASFESPTASKDRLIELVDKAKESAYRAGGKTTPQEEVAYRSKIIEAVRVAQPEIQEAFAAAETLRRKGDLRERYEQSIKSVFNKMDTETINVAVNKLSQTISNNRSKLDKFDEQIELVNSEITEAGLSLSNIFNEINVQRRALGLGARPESELLADLSSEGEFKQPTAAELSSLERPQPTATPKQVKVKKTKAAERAQLALPQLTDSYNMALSNVRFHTRKKNSVTRDKEVSIALIERLNPLMQRIDDVMVDDMPETEKIGTVQAILTRALTGDPADTRAATDYKKASESMKLKASGIVEETTELKDYEKVARMAAPALMKMRNDTTRLNKSVSNVNNAELEQAARIANSEDVARYALESNDPESVLTALRIISKSKVEHHREVAKLLLLAPDFVRSVKFGIVDVRSDWAGIYDSESNAVMVNLSGHNGRGLADVLLHEYLHAATVTYLNDPRTAEQRAAVQRINQLRELAIAQATKKGLMRYAHVRNGLANNAEFLTYTITAPEFQSMLAAMTPTGQRSILSRMIDAILSFFGKKNTLLNKAIKELFDFSQMSLASYHTFNISSRRDIDGIVQIAQDARVAFEDKEFFDSLLERIQSDEYELEQKMSQAPSSAADAEYLAAVEAGDMETAQRMVDEAAKAAGYDNGPFFHGTDSQFTVFDKRGRTGIYFTPDKSLAEAYGNRVMKVFARITSGANANTELTTMESTAKGYDQLVEVLKKYDGVIAYPSEGGSREVLLRDPNQIKSADPVTYDDNGNVIPLSQRFRATSDDIRYIRTAERGGRVVYHMTSNRESLDAGLVQRDLGFSVSATREGVMSSPTLNEPKGSQTVVQFVLNGNGMDYNNPQDRAVIDGIYDTLAYDPTNPVPLDVQLLTELRSRGVDFVDNFNGIGEANGEIHVLKVNALRPFNPTLDRTADTAIDVLGEIRRITPAGINIEIDDTMVGAMGVRRSKPNTIVVNQKYISTLGYGLSEANAKAVVRTAVDEELAHIAANSVFTNDDYLAIAKELGPDMVNRILDMTYSNMEPDDAARAALIAADREAGVTGDLDAAAEWVRMEMTRIATGRTREVDIAFFYTNPSLLERFLEGLKAFIVKLKQQFRATPTTGTAARISQASRSFRKLRNGGVLPTPEPSAANEYGDTTAFFNAVNGDIAEGQEDRTSFMLPVAGTGASKQKTKDFWKMAQDKMYNLPMELRKYLNMRDGTISQIEYTIEDFDRRFPKLRDEALARGASIEDIGMILGTTAPAVQGEARKEIQRKVREFKKDNATDPDLERKAEDYEAQLTQPEADKFFAAFRKEQQAMESKLKNSGFGELVDYLVEFRNEINKYKAVINFDESNDVYLTRTFRFFGSEGWALFAKEGGVAMIDGKEVDFNKLRAAAAKHFEWEVDNDAKQNGQTLTAEQRDKKLIEYLDKYLANLEQEAADAKDLGAMNTVRKDVNRLLRKKDFDAPLRTLLGEVTDPFENAVRTVYSVGRLAANEKFLRNFASKAIEIEVASRTRKPDMELLFPPSQSAQLGDLAGLYVRKDIAATIREELGMNGIKQQSKAMETLNSLGRAMSKFSGLSITAKTLGSVGFYPRNILGGIALTTAQGIVNPVYATQALRLAIISNMSLGGTVKADTEETRNQIRRLTELQILKDETRGRIAMDMLNGFVNSTDQQLEELLNDIVEAQGSGNIEKIVKKFKLEGKWAATKQAGGSTVEFLASLNNVIDSTFKLNAYFFELNALKEAYGDTESEAKLEVDAARKVKLTFPTHSDQLSLAKAFNKSPFSMIVLPFVRWKTEVFRTMFNTVPLAVEEMRSGNPVMRSRGTKRLIGFTSTMIGGGAAYGALFATLFSLLTDDEDDERDGVRKLNDEELDALREGLPKWQRNHGIFAQLLQDGSVQVIDMSNILPYSQLTDLIGLATRGNLKGMADYIASEMVGTQIAASTAFEIAQNRDEFDQPIWLDTDNAVGAFWKMVKHLGGGTVVPSVVDKVIKIGRYGEQNAKEMIVGELTGVRPIIHKTTDIEYRGMRNLKESADAVVSLLYPLSSGKGFNPDKVEGIIDDHQSASNKNQQKLHNFLTGMQSIGSTEASLAATAKQMKFSKQRFGAALEGSNIPWVPNEQWFRKMIDNKMRVGEQNPDEIANEINRVLTQKADVYSTNFLE
jgi:hypothetical protein